MTITLPHPASMANGSGKPPLNVVVAHAMVMEWENKGASLRDESVRRLGPSVEAIRNQAAKSAPTVGQMGNATIWWRANIIERGWTPALFEPFDWLEFLILVESSIMAHKLAWQAMHTLGLPGAPKEPARYRRAEIIAALGYEERSAWRYLTPSSGARVLPFAASWALVQLACHPFGPAGRLAA